MSVNFDSCNNNNINFKQTVNNDDPVCSKPIDNIFFNTLNTSVLYKLQNNNPLISKIKSKLNVKNKLNSNLKHTIKIILTCFIVVVNWLFSKEFLHK